MTIIGSMPVDFEQDVVVARQRAREIASLLGFETQDQARIATALSEIARNAVRYAGRGEVEFAVEGTRAPQAMLIRVTDRGPGIANVDDVLDGRYRSATGMGLGILGARRLMDQCDIRSQPGIGTEVRLAKVLPPHAKAIGSAELERVKQELARGAPSSPLAELQAQHRELLGALAELRERQDQLGRLNRELEDTNRGVVALYAELDEKADHLRRADEMKSRFLSNMSHEFRTPLNSIRALSDLLLAHADGELNDEQEKQVGFIRKAAEDLAQLVEDLLDLAKIEAGKVEVHPIRFSAADLFSTLRGMLRPLLVGQSVTLRFEDPTGVPELYTDEAKVSQIVRNFISNALKFTERGEVIVSAQTGADGHTVVFAVADTGIGIDPDHQERIFEEFVQVRSPLQARVKGTGLGLPLTRKLATLLGGSVNVDSEPGIGSVFTAVIPRCYEAATEAPTPSVPLSTADAWRIPLLVVEDEPELLVFYSKILRGTPYQAIPARNLRDAQEALRNTPPAAILLDILLRGEDTWHWLGALKADPATQRIPVIVVTDVAEARKGLALGADAYLRKPVDRDTLLAELNRVTRSRILIVDDDAATRYSLRRVLDNAGYLVIEAADARAGELAARGARPELIVLDLGLPDMSGNELLQRLRADRSTSSIPIIVATARDLPPAEEQSLRAHVQAVVSKRELGPGLVAAVAAALRAPVSTPEAA